MKGEIRGDDIDELLRLAANARTVLASVDSEKVFAEERYKVNRVLAMLYALEKKLADSR